MPDPLITEADYPAIRRAIDISLDDTTLPGEVIGDDLFLNSALGYVASRTTDTGEHTKKAAIFYCAALLAPSITGQIAAAQSMRIGGAPVKPTSGKELQRHLFARAETELGLIANPDEDSTEAVEHVRPTAFAAGGPGRVWR